MNKRKMVIKRNKAVIAIGVRINNPKFDIGCFNCKESHCCKSNISVGITSIEKDVISPHITEQQKKRSRGSLIQKSLTGSYTCPFLNEEGGCEIYDIRPVTCSSYFVINNTPEDCRNIHDSVHYISQFDILKHLDKSLIFKEEGSRAYDILDMFN